MNKIPDEASIVGVSSGIYIFQYGGSFLLKRLNPNKIFDLPLISVRNIVFILTSILWY